MEKSIQKISCKLNWQKEETKQYTNNLWYYTKNCTEPLASVCLVYKDNYIIWGPTIKVIRLMSCKLKLNNVICGI